MPRAAARAERRRCAAGGGRIDGGELEEHIYGRGPARRVALRGRAVTPIEPAPLGARRGRARARDGDDLGDGASAARAAAQEQRARAADGGRERFVREGESSCAAATCSSAVRRELCAGRLALTDAHRGASRALVVRPARRPRAWCSRGPRCQRRRGHVRPARTAREGRRLLARRRWCARAKSRDERGSARPLMTSATSFDVVTVRNWTTRSPVATRARARILFFSPTVGAPDAPAVAASNFRASSRNHRDAIRTARREGWVDSITEVLERTTTALSIRPGLLGGKAAPAMSSRGCAC